MDRENDPEACPGCRALPGEGNTPGCDDREGCGENRARARAYLSAVERENSRDILSAHVRAKGLSDERNAR